MKAWIILAVWMLWYASTLFSQSFYPLRVGNSWQYEVHDSILDTHDTTVVTVVDTMTIFGKVHFVLNQVDVSNGTYLRNEMDTIVYFEIADHGVYRLAPSNINTSWNHWFNIFNATSFTSTYQDQLFGHTITVNSYNLSGTWASRGIKLADLFGPILCVEYTDIPPYIWLTSTLIGCTIDGTHYGTLANAMDESAPVARVSWCTNSPNPFNPSTSIQFSIAAPAPVTLRVLNVLGQPVRTLIQRKPMTGYHAINWDGRTDRGEMASSGVYISYLTVGDKVLSHKMLLIK